MSNKTAMMQMLEFINELGNNYESKMHAVLCQEKAIELLETEKEDLASAYWASYMEGQYSGDKTAEEYYEETYGKEDRKKTNQSIKKAKIISSNIGEQLPIQFN